MSGEEKFERFIRYLQADDARCAVAARFRRQGVDLARVFAGLVVYIEGRSVAEERRKRGKEDLKIINRGVRDHGVLPMVGRWLRDRAELAHSTNGFSRVQNIDSLQWVHLYLEAKTRRKVTTSELAHLVDAACYALGRRTGKADWVGTGSVELGRALRRHRQRPENAKFLELLRADIARTL